VVVSVIALLDLQLKADSLDAGMAAIHETLTATRAFSGCQGATVLVDSKNAAHVVVYEIWESPDHDRAYREWRASPAGASTLGPVLAAPPGLTLFAPAEGV
jgi:quinol monooxygenase YgiN